MAIPTVDRSTGRLKRSGWSCGDTKFASGHWQVTGRNGENELAVDGETQAEVWHRACQFAESIGDAGAKFC